jgi:twitching motility protein PilT
MNIQDLLLQCVERRASDLHLSSGVPPMVRIDGDLTRLSEAVLSHEEIHQAVVGLSLIHI